MWSQTVVPCGSLVTCLLIRPCKKNDTLLSVVILHMWKLTIVLRITNWQTLAAIRPLLYVNNTTDSALSRHAPSLIHSQFPRWTSENISTTMPACPLVTVAYMLIATVMVSRVLNGSCVIGGMVMGLICMLNAAFLNLCAVACVFFCASLRVCQKAPALWRSLTRLPWWAVETANPANTKCFPNASRMFCNVNMRDSDTVLGWEAHEWNEGDPHTAPCTTLI